MKTNCHLIIKGGEGRCELDHLNSLRSDSKIRDDPYPIALTPSLENKLQLCKKSKYSKFLGLLLKYLIFNSVLFLTETNLSEIVRNQ